MSIYSILIIVMTILFGITQMNYFKLNNDDSVQENKSSVSDVQKSEEDRIDYVKCFSINFTQSNREAISPSGIKVTAEDYNVYEDDEAHHLNIIVKYPQICNMKNKAVQEKINKIIYDDSLAFLNRNFKSNSILYEQDYSIETLTDNILSIYFDRSYYIKPNPSPYFTYGCLNINLSTGNIISFFDISDKEPLLELAENNKYAPVKMVTDLFTLDDYSNYSKLIDIYFSENLDDPDFKHSFCICDNKTIAVFIPLIHVLGDYAIIETAENIAFIRYYEKG